MCSYRRRERGSECVATGERERDSECIATRGEGEVVSV